MELQRLVLIGICTGIYSTVAIAGQNLIAPSYGNNSEPASSVLSAPSALFAQDSKQQMKVVKSEPNIAKAGSDASFAQKKFIFEAGISPDAVYTYIVQLNEPAVAQSPRALAVMLSDKNNSSHTTNRSTMSSNQANSNALSDQISKINAQQALFLAQSSAQFLNIKPLARYQYGLNGLAIRVTQAQAQRLSELAPVKSIRKEQTRKLNTDRGPTLIGAQQVWNGSASSTVSQTSGEGIVIAILDSGINTDHPSFAERGADGYLHSNPRGDGNFLGDCAGNFAQLCNNKLIGVYSYPDITDAYSDTTIFPPNLPKNGEDYGGHGSHVASIAAGNILTNVDEVFPTQGEQRSSGTPTGFTFTQISGVAPHANIISYQVCYGGTEEREDFYADCVDSAILKAIDDAIKDEVDVINYSISGGDNPWLDLTEQAFLSARNAGIFVAVSAGNSGPQNASSDKTAPWYTSVAASEHGRENVFLKQLDAFSGGASTLNTLLGQSNTGSLTAAIVWAGDYANPNDPNGAAQQCLQPFPSGTFSGQIVVCERGDIARIQKAINVRDGGAGGYVLINVEGGETFLANDQYVVPGIHLNADNGNSLKDWLRSGQNHTATLSAGEPSQFIDASRVDLVANYSSRGPNKNIATLVPTISAPGSNIFAAYADEQLGHNAHAPAASDYSTIDGTSMSSPHVAGAAALVKSAHPTWDPDEIRSALALTATTAMKKDDDTGSSTVSANFFDMGSGRVQVNKAISAGLIMSETGNNYTKANPDNLGDPRSLNLPSITDNACEGMCSWSRRFTATTDATFTYEAVTLSPTITISALPSRFTLLQGQSQEVVFTINSLQASKVDYAYGLARFTSPGLPDLSLPVSVLSSIGNFPLEVEIAARRANDSLLLSNIDAISIDSFELTPYKPVKASVVEANIGADSNNSNYLDNATQGVNITPVTVPEDAKRFIAKIKETSALDLDLYVLFDENEDGLPTLNEQIASSRESNSLDQIHINYPQAGTYFIAVHNYLASPIDSDTFDMRYAVVTSDLASSSLRLEAPNQLESNTPFDMRVIYDLPLSKSGDQYFAAVGMGSSVGEENIGLLSVDISRVDDDVFIDGTAARLNSGESASLSAVVNANPSTELRRYRLTLPLPVGTRFTDFSRTNNGQNINNELVWLVEKAAGTDTNTVLNFTIEALSGAAAGPIIVNTKSELLSASFAGVETSENFTAIQLEGAPTFSFDGNTRADLIVTETKTILIGLIVSDPNNDALTVRFTQTAGPLVTIDGTRNSYQLTAPRVEADTLLTYQVTVSDPNGNESMGDFTVNVINNEPPVINELNALANAVGGSSISIAVLASDPENDALQIRINDQSIQGTSANFITPTTGTSVKYVVLVSDGVSEVSETISVNLTQTQVNDVNGSGGSIGFWLILLLPIALMRRLAARQ